MLTQKPSHTTELAKPSVAVWGEEQEKYVASHRQWLDEKKNTDESLIQSNPGSSEAAPCMGLILEQHGGPNHTDIS